MKISELENTPHWLKIASTLDEDVEIINGLLVGKRRRRVRTTYSNHWLRKYPNLIKEFVPIRANQLWVSDITYVETVAGFVYLNLVTDAYSGKYRDWETDRKSTRLNSSHRSLSRMPSSA